MIFVVLDTPSEITRFFLGHLCILGCRFRICKKFWNSSPPPPGVVHGVGFILYLCVRCTKLGYFIGWFRIWKNFLDPIPLGADSGGGTRGQSNEFSLAYLQPCVWCLYLGYLIGWFRIWKQFFDPTPLGADSKAMSKRGLNPENHVNISNGMVVTEISIFTV